MNRWTVKLAKQKELTPYDELVLHMSCFHSAAPEPPRQCCGLLHDQDLWGMSEKHHAQPLQPLQPRLQEHGLPGPPSPGELKIVGKDQDGGRKLTPLGQRDLDRSTGQVAAPKKH
ncbi:hypothetical protein HPG69_002965 [Diceros bicornis minor]|uniref:Uncharacterized protein n=1 Tax=Diceros bicornis minor TaxID=77932 RepID=A0A7J7EJ96_DICBM|nr:hypothetical protein HPG69_002965 [Diceros bicornis minor]